MMAFGCSGTGSARGITKLNNLVTELAHFENISGSGQPALEFENPRDGWVFLTLVADATGEDFVALSIGGKEVIRKVSLGPNITDCFAHLSAGSHSVEVNVQGAVKIDSLSVCAVPELAMRVPGDTTDNAWMMMHQMLMHHLNTLITDAAADSHDLKETWEATGRAWIVDDGTRSTDGVVTLPKPDTANVSPKEFSASIDKMLFDLATSDAGKTVTSLQWPLYNHLPPGMHNFVALLFRYYALDGRTELFRSHHHKLRGGGRQP
jgi:hypothetical protein